MDDTPEIKTKKLLSAETMEGLRITGIYAHCSSRFNLLLWQQDFIECTQCYIVEATLESTL